MSEDDTDSSTHGETQRSFAALSDVELYEALSGLVVAGEALGRERRELEASRRNRWGDPPRNYDRAMVRCPVCDDEGDPDWEGNKCVSCRDYGLEPDHQGRSNSPRGRFYEGSQGLASRGASTSVVQ